MIFNPSLLKLCNLKAAYVDSNVFLLWSCSILHLGVVYLITNIIFPSQKFYLHLMNDYALFTDTLKNW